MRKWGPEKLSCLSRSQSECPWAPSWEWKLRGREPGIGSRVRVPNSKFRDLEMGEQGTREERGWGKSPQAWSRPGPLLQCSKDTSSPGKHGQMLTNGRSVLWKEPCNPGGGSRSLQQACQRECERWGGFGIPALPATRGRSHLSGVGNCIIRNGLL